MASITVTFKNISHNPIVIDETDVVGPGEDKTLALSNDHTFTIGSTEAAPQAHWETGARFHGHP